MIRCRPAQMASEPARPSARSSSHAFCIAAAAVGSLIEKAAHGVKATQHANGWSAPSMWST